MITAIVIPVDQAEPLHLEQLDVHDYDEYRRRVDGYFTILDLNRPRASLYVNQEGQPLELQDNARATVLLWVHHREFRGQRPLVGPAFIVGPPDSDGNATSAPQDLIDLLLSTKRFRVQVLAGGASTWSSRPREFATWVDAYIHGIRLGQRRPDFEEVRVVPVLDNELRETWYRLGLTWPAIADATDPPFTRDSFTGCFGVEELAESISVRSWPAGTAFYYRDLCFIQQTTDDDWWLVIHRDRIVFDGMELIPKIEDETFASLVQRLLAASDR